MLHPLLHPGDLLGIYRLVSRIGAGGMGEVFKAEDTRLGRIVAIKILPAAVASDPDSIARMKREARVAAQLNHPNIAMIHAFEQDGDRVFIVMEYVEGVPLAQLIQRGPLPEDEVCRIGRSVAEALAEAHEKGIVHRDVKPDNIMVNGARVKVLDFGIAKQIEPESTGADDPTAYLTKQGFLVGTVHYMSPEQALGKALDARSDIFSLGVVLYQAATGTLPFRGESATETITQIVRDEPPPPRGISPPLASIIRRCMAKNREARFTTAAEVAHALDEKLGLAPTIITGSKLVTVSEPTLKREARPARRWPWIAGIAALVLAVGIGMAALLGNRPKVAPASGLATSTTAVTATDDAAKQDPPSPSTATVDVKPEPPSTTQAGTTSEDTPTTGHLPAPPAVTEKSAEDLYNEGVTLLVERQPRAARDAFLAAVALDPHDARAHFRLGEMAIFVRDDEEARRRFDAALGDADRLDPRERKLTELGLAVLDHDRLLAAQILRDLDRFGPNDPDLRRFRDLVEERRDKLPPRPRRRRF